MTKASRQMQEQQVADWNARYPVGTPVIVHKDDGTFTESVTRSQAEVLSGHTAVIWIKNLSGCYLLSRVKAKEEL
jgi:hypothetical protein